MGILYSLLVLDLVLFELMKIEVIGAGIHWKPVHITVDVFLHMFTSNLSLARHKTLLLLRLRV